MGRRGWPGGRALAAALTLHLALLALAFHLAGQHEAPTADERAMPVMLVLTDTPLPENRTDEPMPTPPAPTLRPAEPVANPPDATPSEQSAALTPPQPEPPPPARVEGEKQLPGPAKPTPGAGKKAGSPGERPKRWAREHAAASNAPAPAAPKAGVAVYDVVVDASGQIRSITLAHSSGITSFDASGEAMIRSGMGFEAPPADQSQELRLFTVSIAFAPEER